MQGLRRLRLSGPARFVTGLCAGIVLILCVREVYSRMAPQVASAQLATADQVAADLKLKATADNRWSQVLKDKLQVLTESTDIRVKSLTRMMQQSGATTSRLQTKVAQIEQDREASDTQLSTDAASIAQLQHELSASQAQNKHLTLAHDKEIALVKDQLVQLSLLTKTQLSAVREELAASQKQQALVQKEQVAQLSALPSEFAASQQQLLLARKTHAVAESPTGVTKQSASTPHIYQQGINPNVL